MDGLWHCFTHIISIDGDSEIWDAEVLLGIRHSFQNVIFHVILMIPTLRFSVILPILQRDVSQIWAPKVIMKGFPSFAHVFSYLHWRFEAGCHLWHRKEDARGEPAAHADGDGDEDRGEVATEGGVVQAGAILLGVAMVFSPPLLKMAGYGLWKTCQWGIEPPRCGTLMLGKWWWANGFGGTLFCRQSQVKDVAVFFVINFWSWTFGRWWCWILKILEDFWCLKHLETLEEFFFGTQKSCSQTAG